MSAEKLLKSISSYLKSTLSPGKVNQYIRLKVVQAHIEDIDEAIKLLAQPEQPEPVYWENEKKALLNEIDHLTNRLAQPELSTDSLQLDEQDLREKPLSEQFISVANQSSLEATRLAFRQGVRFAEKAHGIG